MNIKEMLLTILDDYLNKVGISHVVSPARYNHWFPPKIEFEESHISFWNIEIMACSDGRNKSFEYPDISDPKFVPEEWAEGLITYMIQKNILTAPKIAGKRTIEKLSK